MGDTQPHSLLPAPLPTLTPPRSVQGYGKHSYGGWFYPGSGATEDTRPLPPPTPLRPPEADPAQPPLAELIAEDPDGEFTRRCVPFIVNYNTVYMFIHPNRFMVGWSVLCMYPSGTHTHKNNNINSHTLACMHHF